MNHFRSAVAWEAARKVPSKGHALPGKNIFKGGYSLESALISGVPVARLNVWPQGAAQPPRSYAVPSLSSQGEEAQSGPQIQEDWPKDVFDEDFPGPEEDRRLSQKPDVDYSAEFEEANYDKDWQPAPDLVLPLNFNWQQSAESRWDFSFDLNEGAQCLGLGERLSGLNLRSKVHTLFNSDCHNHTPALDPMYKSIPFLIVRDGGEHYALFLDSPARQRWSLDEDLIGQGRIELLSRRGWQMYIFGPSTLPEIIEAYTSITGRHRLPPIWALGHHQSRWSYPDQETVVRIAYEFRQRQIPCDVIVLDIDYMDDYRVFTASSERFPELANLVADLRANNFRVVAIVDPGVKKDSKFFIFNDGKKHGYFCMRKDGKIFLARVWPGLSAFPDFLKESTRLWWAAQHGFHTDLGIAGIWNDMNEPSMFDFNQPLPENATELPADGNQLFLQESAEGPVGHFEVRNLYGLLMSRSTCEGLLALRPNRRPFVLSRSAYAGIQRYAAVWLGDNHSWWEHLKMSIPMLLNMGLSGVAFAGVDIGGFGGDSSGELLARWYALGLFYPFFRNHCAMQGIAQEPWAFGPYVESCCKKFIETRYRLIPYIQSLFWEHRRTGAPLMRPLSWHYPEDEFAAEVDDQFLLGENILVAPILERAKKQRTVYLPEGLWHPFEGGEPLSGGLHEIKYALDQVPAFVRDGAVLPLADIVQSTNDLHEAAITFACYGEKCKGSYFEDDGASLNYESGQFNEWRIKVEDGEFIAQPVELGDVKFKREYRLQCRGKLTQVNLE